MKRALVTGAAGQHGSYMCELLLDAGYDVTGLVRPHMTATQDNLAHSRSMGLRIMAGDMLNEHTLLRIVLAQFDEIYHFAAQSHVAVSFDCPTYTYEVNAQASIKLLELLKQYSPHTRLYFAATSEMLPHSTHPQDENAPLGANSPYAASKLAAYLQCKVYERTGQLHVVTGITFNSESPRRGSLFLTQKVCQGVAAYRRTRVPVKLGTLSTSRDWHHALDTVRGIYAAMQYPTPDTYVFASGQSHTVREWVQGVCDYFGVPVDTVVQLDERLARPIDVAYLCGDPSKAERVLGWRREYDFAPLIADMCAACEHEEVPTL